MITPAQIRASRGILKWSARKLAVKAEIGVQTVQRMEQNGGTENALGKNVMAVQRALESAGIEFIPENGGGAGVREKKPKNNDTEQPQKESEGEAE